LLDFLLNILSYYIKYMILFNSAHSLFYLFPRSVSFPLTHQVLVILGSIPIGCHGIAVSPEDPPLGTFHRIMLDESLGIRNVIMSVGGQQV